MNFEAIWEMREEEIYPRLFGPLSRGIFPLEYDTFARFGATRLNPCWLHHGVLEFGPTQNRTSWVYVTSGHSNQYAEKHENDLEYVEFALSVTEPGDWAIRCLQSIMAFDTLLRAGHYPGKKPLDLSDRIPLHGPLNGDAMCVLTRLMVTEAEDYSNFDTPAGPVKIRSLTGISEAEWAFAREGIAETEILVDQLKRAGHHPVNDPWRLSLL